jgi:DNA processing protein
MDDRRFWLAFNKVPGVGPVRTHQLLHHFGDLGSAWTAPAHDLAAAGLDTRAVAAVLALRRTLDLDAEIARLETAGAHLLTWADAAYPARLRDEMDDPPPVLYVRGEIQPDDAQAVALVGTRRATPYGREVAHQLASGLAAAGITVVSGLALGIDTVAHRAALDAGGRTLAVLGSGVDVIYPPQNRDLAARIVAEDRGAILSDYALGTGPEAANFPPRNRIISGLVRGVVIVEADLKSGAMITARFALEQGRDVFAVPGSILSHHSDGPNSLLKEGAAPITGVDDILSALDLTRLPEQQTARAVLPANATEGLLLQLLTNGPLHVDDLGRHSGLPIHEVSSTLTMMELKGLVRQVGPMQYSAAR